MRGIEKNFLEEFVRFLFLKIQLLTHNVDNFFVFDKLYERLEGIYRPRCGPGKMCVSSTER